MFLVPVMALRIGGNGLNVGDGWQRGVHFQTVTILDLPQNGAKVLFTKSAEYDFIQDRDVFDFD